MKRLMLLLSLVALIYCGTTAAVPADKAAPPPLRVTSLAATLHRTASTNWVVLTWSFASDGKGAIDSAYTWINCCSVQGSVTHQLPGSATVDSFDVGLVAPGATGTWVVQAWGKRSGSVGPKSAPDTVSFTAAGGPPPAPTITGVTVH